MPNGKPGDHPLTDILLHRLGTYDAETDALIREIAALAQLRAFRGLDDLMFDAQAAPELVPKLRRRLEKLRWKLERP